MQNTLGKSANSSGVYDEMFRRKCGKQKKMVVGCKKVDIKYRIVCDLGVIAPHKIINALNYLEN